MVASSAAASVAGAAGVAVAVAEARVVAGLGVGDGLVDDWVALLLTADGVGKVGRGVSLLVHPASSATEAAAAAIVVCGFPQGMARSVTNPRDNSNRSPQPGTVSTATPLSRFEWR